MTALHNQNLTINRVTAKQNGVGDIHPPFPFFIYACQSFLASNSSGGSENIPEWLWLWCTAAYQLPACPKRA